MRDAFGREIVVPREEWRTKVLPANVGLHWNDPDALYGTILPALQEGFAPEVLDAAERLHQIDPIPERGACIYGIALTKNHRLDEAERVLLACLRKHGQSGVVLTNLAKVYADRDEMERAREMLWRALQADPNQDNGLTWYQAWHREESGEEAGLEALRRVAALPGSWRAQLGLAGAALASGDRETALALYDEILSRLGKDVPADVLMQISGTLGGHGHLAEVLRLAGPRFVAEAHGVQVGNNLIKAHLDLGHVEEARRIVDQLYALRRPDWTGVLNYWEGEIARAALPRGAGDAPPPEIGLTALEGPVWLGSASPAASLFPESDPDAPLVCFLGSSADVDPNAREVEHQLTDPPGRMSRALPLFLAEQVQLTTGARVLTIIPRVTGDTGGFVLTQEAWPDEDAARYARLGEVPADYVVVPT